MIHPLGMMEMEMEEIPIHQLTRETEEMEETEETVKEMVKEMVKEIVDQKKK